MNKSIVDKDVIKYEKVLHCEKCKNERTTPEGITVQYRGPIRHMGTAMSGEDLLWTCKRCGYRWQTETLDKYKEE